MDRLRSTDQDTGDERSTSFSPQHSHTHSLNTNIIAETNSKSNATIWKYCQLSSLYRRKVCSTFASFNKSNNFCDAFAPPRFSQNSFSEFQTPRKQISFKKTFSALKPNENSDKVRKFVRSADRETNTVETIGSELDSSVLYDISTEKKRRSSDTRRFPDVPSRLQWSYDSLNFQLLKNAFQWFFIFVTMA